jgi:hypothetical protein
MYSSHPESKRARFQIVGSSSKASILFDLLLHYHIYIYLGPLIEQYHHPDLRLGSCRNTATTTATAPVSKSALESPETTFIFRPQPKIRQASKMASSLTRYIFQPQTCYSKPEKAHMPTVTVLECSNEIIFVVKDCLSSESYVGNYSQSVSRSDLLHIFRLAMGTRFHFGPVVQ